jgi:zinc transporter ZupT
MTDEQRRAWRASFCYWVGDSVLAAGASALGALVGDIICPCMLPLVIIHLVFGFLEGLILGAFVRAFLKELSRHNTWLFRWFLFGIATPFLNTVLFFRSHN